MASQKISAALAAVMLAALAACGGGGGSSSTATPAPVAETPTVPTQPDIIPTTPAPSSPATLVSATSPLNYPAASEELQAFTLLNSERERCGFGLLAQSPALDSAALAHANYQLVNNLNSHFEDRTAYPTGFTGVTPGDRIVAAGYSDFRAVQDEYVFFSSPNKAGRGPEAMRALLNAPYHMAGLLSGFRDAGIAVLAGPDLRLSRPSTYVQIDLAYKAGTGPQQLAGTDVKTYPCEGSTGVNRQLTNESPNPVPGRDLATVPLGTSVYVGVRDGQTVRINSATMTKMSTGGAIALRTPVSTANDPQGACTAGCLLKNQAYVAANAPLEANTAYQVTVTGTNEATPFSRTFTFTTGTGG